MLEMVSKKYMWHKKCLEGETRSLERGVGWELSAINTIDRNALK